MSRSGWEKLPGGPCEGDEGRRWGRIVGVSDGTRILQFPEGGCRMYDEQDVKFTFISMKIFYSKTVYSLFSPGPSGYKLSEISSRSDDHKN